MYLLEVMILFQISANPSSLFQISAYLQNRQKGFELDLLNLLKSRTKSTWHRFWMNMTIICGNDLKKKPMEWMVSQKYLIKWSLSKALLFEVQSLYIFLGSLWLKKKDCLDVWIFAELLISYLSFLLQSQICMMQWTNLHYFREPKPNWTFLFHSGYLSHFRRFLGVFLKISTSTQWDRSSCFYVI